MSLSSAATSSSSLSILISHIALGLSTLILGYWLGVGHSLFTYNSSLHKRKRRHDPLGSTSSSSTDCSEVEVDLNDRDSSEGEEGGEGTQEMNAIKKGLRKLSGAGGAAAAAAAAGEEWKLVLCVRMDLKMDKGKMAAQCCHATLACYQSLLSSKPQLLKHWQRQGQAKVALKCPTEADMDKLAEHARSLGLTAKSIRDAGRTQVAAGSKTVLGIGPGPVRIVDQVTAHLKLL